MKISLQLGNVSDIRLACK